MAYQGEPGAFSEAAALQMEPAAQPVPCRTLAEVFAKVETRQVDAGLVPVENSLAGSVGETYDLLLTHNLVVTGETVLPIDHCLMALPDTELCQVRQVFSHPQALSQCDAYLGSLGAECVPHYDTAGAAKYIKESGAATAAAVASRRAAGIYGLRILAEQIQSNRENFTRFYRIEREHRSPGLRSRTVFVVGLPHHPGSLFMALSSFACRGINLTKIESRPVRRNPWEYVFFLEFEGHVDDWQVRPALDELRSKTSMLRTLGSFALEE
ncbi:MAG: prephenate dehydratase [Ignavibacteriales bacterium]